MTTIMLRIVNYDILHQRTSVKLDGEAIVVRALTTSALGRGCDAIHLVLLRRMLQISNFEVLKQSRDTVRFFEGVFYVRISILYKTPVLPTAILF